VIENIKPSWISTALFSNFSSPVNMVAFISAVFIALEFLDKKNPLRFGEDLKY